MHLGTRGSNAPALLRFLRDHDFETLYIVGDFIDIWSLRRGLFWPQTHNDVLQKILRKGRKGARILYIPGNHDEFVSGFLGTYGAIELVPHAIHETAAGRRLLVMHGHELDTVIQTMKWMAFVGDLGYQLLLNLNGPVNAIRRLFGLGYWSLSAHVKKNVKDAVAFIGRFEEAVVRYAKDHGVSGVVCGHIHTPVIRRLGAIDYFNAGDWVESCTALVEDFDGRIRLIHEPPDEPGATDPRPADDEEPPGGGAGDPGRLPGGVPARLAGRPPDGPAAAAAHPSNAARRIAQ